MPNKKLKEFEKERARLIPVAGIRSENTAEAEQRATSALLAVMTIVRDFSIELLAPFGAPRARNADVEAFTEVLCELEGKKVRADGLISVSSRGSTWQAYVEVKTGNNKLTAEQINKYWDLAKTSKVNCVLTISNEIASQQGAHPTPNLRPYASSPVQVVHLSWSHILTTAIKLHKHAGVDDREQAWILKELIEYLGHESSGVVALSDMGPHWTDVRDKAITGSLTKRSVGVGDIAAKFDQLLAHEALQLGAEIGKEVSPVLPRAHQKEPALRHSHLIESLASEGRLSGTLRIPNTAGDLDIEVDLRPQLLFLSTTLDAPDDRGPSPRVTWLINQLESAPESLKIEAYAKNARTPESAELKAVRTDRLSIVPDKERPPTKFSLVWSTQLGIGRGDKRQRSSSFIESITTGIQTFYEQVLQDLTPFVRQPPRIPKQEPTTLEPDIESTEPEASDQLPQ